MYDYTYYLIYKAECFLCVCLSFLYRNHKICVHICTHTQTQTHYIYRHMCRFLKHLDYLVPNNDFLVLHCVGILQSLSGVVSN